MHTQAAPYAKAAQRIVGTQAAATALEELLQLTPHSEPAAIQLGNAQDVLIETGVRKTRQAIVNWIKHNSRTVK